MQYRRSNVKGGSYFFTVTLANRQRTYLTDYVDLLRNAIKTVKQNHPFYIDAFVVLPDHLHAIWTLPMHDDDYSTRWSLIKSTFSRQITPGEERSKSRLSKAERGIWQRRFWEHTIRNEEDYSRHVEYIHYNPVKHGQVEHASEWPYSSIHRFIRNGIINADWGCEKFNDDGGFGE